MESPLLFIRLKNRESAECHVRGTTHGVIGRIVGDAQQSNLALYVQFNLTYWQRNGVEFAGNLVCWGNSSFVCVVSTVVQSGNFNRRLRRKCGGLGRNSPLIVIFAVAFNEFFDRGILFKKTINRCLYSLSS